METPERRKRWLACALFALASPFVTEGAVRGRAWLKYGSHRDIYALTHVLPESGLRAVRPNLDLEFARRSRITTDSRGFRSPELEVPRPPRTVRLAFLGGSTTFCGQASSNATTWPARVSRALAEAHPRLAVDFANAGVTGSSVADSLTSLRERLRPVQPNVVVVLHAAKDLADDTRALALERGLPLEPLAAEDGWLARHSEAWRLVRLNLWFLRSQELGAGGRKLTYDADALARGFEARLEELVHEAGEVADVVVLVTFATRVRAEQPLEQQLENLQQAFTFTPYLTPAGVLAGYAAYNAAIERVAARTGAVLVRGEDALPGTGEYFSDSVHFTERGYVAMAERVSDALLEAPPFEALVRRLNAEEAPR